MSATTVLPAIPRFERSWLIAVFMGLLTLAAVAELRIDRRDRDLYLTDDFGSVITDDYGNGISIGHERQFQIVAGNTRIGMPVWAERTAE